MSNYAFGVHVSALLCDRCSARGPKWPFCVFCNPDPSRSNEPRHSGTCICSRGTSDIYIMSNYAFGVHVSALLCDRRSGGGPKWPFCVFCNPDPSRSNEPRHSGTCICSRGTSHVPIMSNYAFSRCVFSLPCDRRSGSGPKIAILCVFHTTSKHFSRSAEPMFVCLFTPPTRFILSSSDNSRFPRSDSRWHVAGARRVVQNGCSACFM